MTTSELLTSTWAWEPSVLIGCAALEAAYLLGARPPAARAAPFTAGVLVLLLALISPLDTLGDTYLFSAHMLQHLLLVLVVPPLLLYGLPARPVALALRWPPLDRWARALSRPPVAWAVGTGTLWLWHAPALYDLALTEPGIHILQHLTFLVSATIFWWPVLGPLPQRRLVPLAALAYLFAASVDNGVLGVVLSFAPPGLYPAYAHPPATRGILLLVRRQWGLSGTIDQQAGGLLMWALGAPTYLLAGLSVLARWFGESEEEQHRSSRCLSQERVVP
jgi:cytochrome c oxidase assembly factor CtaG